MASGKGNNNSIGFLEMLFQATQSTDYVGLVRNDTSPLTVLYVSLHTANPGATGAQNTSEATYGGGTGYARVSVARASGAGGWAISGETITNFSAITFGACAGGTGETETYVGIGTASSGPGVLLWFGQLTSSLAVSNGITPNIAAAALSITEA
jgi:hypothetical protein